MDIINPANSCMHQCSGINECMGNIFFSESKEKMYGFTIVRKMVLDGNNCIKTIVYHCMRVIDNIRYELKIGFKCI